ncbi:MAG: hypothetical protein K2N13_07115 [Paraprevotella sp.]|nr:hypothetical protein [Paraprevotella sp.]
MKTFLFFAVAAVGLSLGNQSVQARSWRIHSNANVKPDFTSIKAAMSSNDVMPGDTLYLEPGCVLSGQSISKKVTVIGPGYDFSGAGSLTAVLYGDTGLNVDGIKIEGCSMDRVYINKANCTVERCKVTEVRHNSSGTSMASILSCYITKCINIYQSSKNCTISNCIILGYIDGLSTSTISNNVFVGENTSELLRAVTYSVITNNVILNTKSGYVLDASQEPQFYKNYTIKNNTLGSGNTITNNILSTDAEHAFNDYPNNKFIGATPEDIFVMEGIGEEVYRLKEGSPVIGYGTGGYDCGVFSGSFPYVLSGRPRYIPYIYDAIIPNQPTDGKLNVTLKIKSQHE